MTPQPDCFVPVFWEPVAASGERLLAGAIVRFQNQVSAHRILRDDVLDCLYGKRAAAVRTLLDTNLDMVRAVGEFDMGHIAAPMSGFSTGTPRFTEPTSVADALRVCALMHSSLANINAFDEMEDSDAPAPEEANRRFSTSVRETVCSRKPELERYFGLAAELVPGGEPVRFGFCSPHSVLHFSVLHPVRQAAGVRDARARFWELSRARELARLPLAALIMATPMENDPTLSSRQVGALRRNLHEIEQEADNNAMRFLAVHTVDAASDRVIEFA